MTRFAVGGWQHQPTTEDWARLRAMLEGEGDHQLPPADDSHVGEELD